MKKQIYILILIAISLSFATLSAQEGALQRSRSGSIISNDPNNVPQDLRDKITNFFTTIEKNNISDAYEAFLKDSPIADNTDDVKNLVSQTKRSFDIYGTMKGVEFVNAEFITNSYFRARYLGLHALYPMRWIFTFYKSPTKGWIVTNMKFDDLSEYFFSDQ